MKTSYNNKLVKTDSSSSSDSTPSSINNLHNNVNGNSSANKNAIKNGTKKVTQNATQKATAHTTVAANDVTVTDATTTHEQEENIIKRQEKQIHILAKELIKANKKNDELIDDLRASHNDVLYLGQKFQKLQGIIPENITTNQEEEVQLSPIHATNFSPTDTTNTSFNFDEPSHTTASNVANNKHVLSKEDKYIIKNQNNNKMIKVESNSAYQDDNDEHYDYDQKLRANEKDKAVASKSAAKAKKKLSPCQDDDRKLRANEKYIKPVASKSALSKEKKNKSSRRQDDDGPQYVLDSDEFYADDDEQKLQNEKTKSTTSKSEAKEKQKDPPCRDDGPQHVLDSDEFYADDDDQNLRSEKCRAAICEPASYDLELAVQNKNKRNERPAQLLAHQDFTDKRSTRKELITTDKMDIHNEKYRNYSSGGREEEKDEEEPPSYDEEIAVTSVAQRRDNPATASLPGAFSVDGARRGRQNLSSYDSSLVMLSSAEQIEQPQTQPQQQKEIVVPNAIPVTDEEVYEAAEFDDSDDVKKMKSRIRFLILSVFIFILVVCIVVPILVIREDDKSNDKEEDSIETSQITFVLRLDSDPDQTGWRLDCINQGRGVAGVEPGAMYSLGFNQTVSTPIQDLQTNDTCTLTIFDTGNDGIVGGYHEIYYGDKNDTLDTTMLLVSGDGNFTNETTSVFNVTPPYNKHPTDKENTTDINTVMIQLDSTPSQNGFTLSCGSRGTVFNAKPGLYQDIIYENGIINLHVPVILGEVCNLTIVDSGGDGIDNGYYEVYCGANSLDKTMLLVSGNGDFTNEKTSSFTVAPRYVEPPFYKNTTDITLVVKFDSTPSQNGFTLTCGTRGTVFNTNQVMYHDAIYKNNIINFLIPVVIGEICSFTVADSGGDGIDNGYYEVYYGTNSPDKTMLLASGNGNFTHEKTSGFTVTLPYDKHPTNRKNTTDITLVIQFDTTPSQNGITLDCGLRGTVFNAKPGLFQDIIYDRARIIQRVPVIKGENCTLTIIDTSSNGINNDGYYEIYYGTDTKNSGSRLVRCPHNFVSETSINFTVKLPYTQWIQVGQDIDGLNQNDRSGTSVSMSSSGDVVIGAPADYDPTSLDFQRRPGSTQVYTFNSSTNIWILIDQSLDSGSISTSHEQDLFGQVVSSSNDGTSMAVGAPYKNDMIGAVYIYNINKATNTISLLQELRGNNTGDMFGSSLAMSGDGSTVIVGAEGSNEYAKVYSNDNNNNNWIQRGKIQLDGISGAGLAISYDGSVVAIGVPWANSAKIVHYNRSSDQWYDYGNNNDDVLLFDPATDMFGFFMALSSDGRVVAVSVPLSDGIDRNIEDVGIVKVFRLNSHSNNWEQLGSNIYGEFAYDNAGVVSLSDNGMILAIGSHLNNNGDREAWEVGHVRVYEYDSDANDWVQISQDIDGEAKYDASGVSLSLSGDGSMVAIGAPGNDGKDPNEFNCGHVRVYRRVNNSAP